MSTYEIVFTAEADSVEAAYKAFENDLFGDKVSGWRDHCEIKDVTPSSVDTDTLARLLDRAPWEIRTDRGGDNYARIDGLAYAINWACHSCRDDVGWPESETATKNNGEIVLYITCGHCGAMNAFDVDGEPLDES